MEWSSTVDSKLLTYTPSVVNTFQSWTKLYVPGYVICTFILSIHTFDLKYNPFVFLYIFLLTVFIVMYQNI